MKTNMQIASTLLGLSILLSASVRAESIVNGDFSAGSTGWTVANTQTDSTFDFTGGFATIVDSGDPTDPASTQELYQDFTALSGTVSFSYDFRFNGDFAGDAVRVELYTGAFGTDDVFRMILNSDDAGDNNFRVNLVGPNLAVDLNPTPGADVWLSVAGSVDLVNDTTSGTITSLDGLTTYGSWSAGLSNAAATTITGFAFYDTNASTVGSSISLDNVSVIPEPGSLVLVGLTALAAVALKVRRR